MTNFQDSKSLPSIPILFNHITYILSTTCLFNYIGMAGHSIFDTLSLLNKLSSCGLTLKRRTWMKSFYRLLVIIFTFTLQTIQSGIWGPQVIGLNRSFMNNFSPRNLKLFWTGNKHSSRFYCPGLYWRPLLAKQLFFQSYGTSFNRARKYFPTILP